MSNDASNKVGFKTKSTKITGDLALLAVGEAQDATNETSYKVISKYIKEKFNVDVDNELLEDFLDGFSNQLIQYITFEIVGGATTALVSALTVEKTKLILEKILFKRKRQIKSAVSEVIGDLPKGSGKLGTMVSKDVLGGLGDSQAIEEVNSTLQYQMAVGNSITAFSTGLDLGDVVLDSHLSKKDLEGGDNNVDSARMLKEMLGQLIIMKAHPYDQ